MEENKGKDMLKPRLQGMRKPSKGICHFLVPSKMMKEGRTIITKRCIAYIPGFEVTDDRLICELCLVPDMLVREDRCRYFSPLEVTTDSPTSWKCGKTGKKWIEAAQCTCELCPDYECSSKGKWEIGRMRAAEERHDEHTKTCQAPASSPAKDDGGKKSRLIPKTTIMKKKSGKAEEE